jgi:hypothetical protein
VSMEAIWGYLDVLLHSVSGSYNHHGRGDALSAAGGSGIGPRTRAGGPRTKFRVCHPPGKSCTPFRSTSGAINSLP